MQIKLNRLATATIYLILFGALSACGRGPGDTVTTQIAAKVNGSEISVHQLNDVLGREGEVAASAGAADQHAGAALDRIIDQELLVQKALDAKLDRDAQVLQMLSNARREVLAQAYLERSLRVAPSTPAELHRFYVENPLLFEQRRIYHLQEVASVIPADKLAEVQETASKAADLNDVAAWLKSQGIEFRSVSSVMPAEQLPLYLLPKLTELKEKQIAVLPLAQGNATVVLQVTQSQPAPLTERQATPLIEQFLANRKRLELTEVEVKRLRDQAKIEYKNGYKGSRESVSVRSASYSAANASAPLSAPISTPAARNLAVVTLASDAVHREKGIAGLR